MRVLLIEDDRRISSSLTRTLQDEGYAVDCAYDGAEGEELAMVNPYDVIILDIMLPGQDGWETCDNIRNGGILSPILILSALDQTPDKVRGLDYGADDYLTKPFHTDELLARLRSLIRRRMEVRSTTLEYSGLILDLATHKAARDGTTIPLTTKEFSLLELFMMHKGKILSREMITEHLWDMNFDPRSNVIESYIKFLRKKIDKGFPYPLIHTVRGAGYMLSEDAP